MWCYLPIQSMKYVYWIQVNDSNDYQGIFFLSYMLHCFNINHISRQNVLHTAGTVASTAEGKKMFEDPVVIKVHYGFASVRAQN